MKYSEFNISTRDALHAEILTALLSDYPFESFCEEEGVLKAYIQSDELGSCRDDVAQLLSEQEAKK